MPAQPGRQHAATTADIEVEGNIYLKGETKLASMGCAYRKDANPLGGIRRRWDQIGCL